MKSGLEQRRHPRYAPLREVFVHFPEADGEMGWVRDMSMGGLGLSYQAENGLADGQTHVDLFVSGEKELFAARIPCEVVYDAPLDVEGGSLYGNTRKCGLRFGMMNPDQRAMLGRILGQVGHQLTSEYYSSPGA